MGEKKVLAPEEISSMVLTRSSFISSLLVQNNSKKWKTKHSCIGLFTVSGMFTHSMWCCLQRCEHSMHNCTLLSFEVS